VPVAVKCCLNPLATEGFVGVTAIDTSVAGVTVNKSAGEVAPFRLAVMLLVPTPTPVAKPPEAIVVTVVVAEFHVAEVVRFEVLVSV